MVFDDDLGSGDGDGDVETDVSGTRCWSYEHWRLVGLSSLAMVLYVPTCLCFLRAGGELRNLEVDVRKPLDWSRDKVSMEAEEFIAKERYSRAEHPLETGSAKFDAMEICIKLFLTITALLGATLGRIHSRPIDSDSTATATAVANATAIDGEEEEVLWFGFLSHDMLVNALTFAQALLLVAVTVWCPPHVSKGAAQLRFILNAAAAWLMLYALETTVLGEDSGSNFT